MTENFRQHCTEASLELYAMGKLDNAGTEILEEHLLICEGCRMQLDEWDTFVRSMKAGAARLREEPEEVTETFLDRMRRWLVLPAPVVTATAVSVLAIVSVSTFELQHRRAAALQSLAPIPLSLVAERGGSIPVPAHRILNLTLDTRGLALGPKARVQVVNAIGSQIVEKTVPQAGETLTLQVAKPLEDGTYFVRLYRSNSDDPVREFALDVR